MEPGSRVVIPGPVEPGPENSAMCSAGTLSPTASSAVFLHRSAPSALRPLLLCCQAQTGMQAGLRRDTRVLSPGVTLGPRGPHGSAVSMVPTEDSERVPGRHRAPDCSCLALKGRRERATHAHCSAVPAGAPQLALHDASPQAVSALRELIPKSQGIILLPQIFLEGTYTGQVPLVPPTTTTAPRARWCLPELSTGLGTPA